MISGSITGPKISEYNTATNIVKHKIRQDQNMYHDTSHILILYHDTT